MKKYKCDGIIAYIDDSECLNKNKNTKTFVINTEGSMNVKTVRRCMFCDKGTESLDEYVCEECKNSFKKMKKFLKVFDETTTEMRSFTEEEQKQYDKLLKSKSITTEITIDDMFKINNYSITGYSMPLFKCPNCGAFSMCRDEKVVLTGYPPKYKYECRKEHRGCGCYTEIR